MIDSLHLQALKNHEFSQFIKHFTEFAKDKPELLNAVEILFNNIEAKNKDIVNLMNYAKGSNLTEIVLQLDDSRDKAATGISQMLEALTYHFEEDIADAAKELLESMSKYGKNITRASYQEETSIMSQWVNDWKNDSRLAECVNKVQLTDWVSKMGNDNDELDRVYVKRIKQESELPDEKIVDLRKEMVSMYRQLVQHIEAHAVISGHKEFIIFIDQVNVLIEKYNKLAKSNKKDVEPIA